MSYKRIFIFLLLLLILSFAASGVQAQEMPFIEASVNGDWMAVYAFEPSGTINITIYDYEGASNPFSTSVLLDGDGNARLDPDVLGRNLVAGNHILATDGTTTKDLVLVSLSVSGVDCESDTVWGTAETALPLRVQVGDDQQSFSLDVSLDTNGEWFADFGAENIEILDHYWIGVIATEEDGDWTLAELRPPPYIIGNITGDWVSINEFPLNTTVTISVFDGLGDDDPKCSGDLVTDPGGSAWLDCGEEGLDAGNYITADDGETLKELLLVPFTLDVFDPEADIISGTADPGTPVRVDVWVDEANNASLEVVTGDDGNWEADFGGYDVLEEAWYAAFITDDDGDSTMAELTPPQPPPSLPYFAANITGGWISADGFPSDTDVTVDVYEGELPSELRFSATQRTDEFGSAWFDFWEQGLYPYNYVEVTDGVITKDLVIQPLTLDAFDPEVDIISGTALPGTPVRVDVWVDETNNASLEVMTDEDGNWLADFNTIEPDGYDLLEEAWYAAFITDGDGDSTMAELPPPPSLPFFAANVTGGWIAADEFLPDTDVTVDVYEGELPSALRFSATLPTNEFGSAWFDFWEQGLYPYNYVEVTDGVITKDLVILPLTLDVFNPDADIISGTALPGTPVRVDVWVDENNNTSLEVMSDDDGNWEADFKTIEPDGYDILKEAWYAAFISDDDGDSTMAELPPPPPLPWIEANITGDWIEVFGFPPSIPVTISAYEIPGDEVPKCEKMVDSDEVGYAHIECWEVGLEPGNFVVATDGEITKDLLLVPLTVDVFDPESSLITGTADAGTFVVVNVYNPPPEDTFASLEVQADPDGNWSAVFTDFTMTPDTWYAAYVYDEEGDATMAELTPQPPLPFILAWPEWDLVSGIGFPEEVTVDLIIDDDEDPTNPPLYSTSGTTGLAPWDPSETLVEFALEGFVDLQHGHIVVLIYEDIVKVHFVTALEVVVVRPYVDKIIGTAEPFSGIDLWVHEDPEISISVEAGKYGLWIADFTGAYDIKPDTQGIAAQFDEDGDATFIEWSWLEQGGWWRRFRRWKKSEPRCEDFRTGSRHRWRSSSLPCTRECAFSRSTDCRSSSTERRDRWDTKSERRLWTE